MPLLLRCDIDKPYGNHTLIRRVISKAREDYLFPAIGLFNYLDHVKQLILFCNSFGVRAHLYHRLCTMPDARTMELILSGGHHFGFHSENTRSFETFVEELALFRKKAYPLIVNSFNKHGSGILKLGRNHYPQYEPDKYRSWSCKIDVQFSFGNGIVSEPSDFDDCINYFPKMFWIEREYRDLKFNALEELVLLGKSKNVVLLIHPSNFISNENVFNDLKAVFTLASQNRIDWKLIDELKS